MSGLFGCIDFSGAPLPMGDLQRMHDAMAFWGPDGSGRIEEGCAGLGHLKLLTLPESVYESLPRRHGETGLWYTATARLDERDHLCDALGIPHPERPRTPDTEVLLRAWLKWGEAIYPKLGGDWAFALWDPRERRLVLARDPYGATALFYTQQGSRFAFASHLRALTALDWVPRDPDELFLAMGLIRGPISCAGTAFASIQRVRPAHVLTVDACSTRTSQLWKFEDAPEVRFSREEDYVDRYMELFREAVRCRLRSTGPVGSMLSGGRDSSSVAAMAATLLDAQPLAAFTSVPRFQGYSIPAHWMGDEGPAAASVAARYPNIQHHLEDAAGVSPLEGLEEAARFKGEPPLPAGNQYWGVAILRRAQAMGIKVLLDGGAGNAGFSYYGPPNRSFDLWKSGHWLECARELKGWKQETGRPWWWTLGSQMVRPGLFPMKRAYQRLTLGQRRPWLEITPLHPGIDRKLDLAAALQAGFHPLWSPARFPDGDLMRFLLVTIGEMTGSLMNVTGAAFGLDSRDPTADTRLLAFCWGVPIEQHCYRGVTSRLIKRGMRDHLPPEILAIRRKGLQAWDLGSRILECRPALASILDRMAESRICSAWMDLARLRRMLSVNDLNQMAAIEDGLLGGVGLGLHFLNLEHPPRDDHPMREEQKALAPSHECIQTSCSTEA